MLAALLKLCGFKASASESRRSSVSTKLFPNGTEMPPDSPFPKRREGGPAPYDTPPPPVIDAEIRSSFNSVDTDGSGYITATELQSALIKGGWASFEIDTVKLLMSIFDTNRNGTIDINEFGGLWKYIKTWEGVFRRFDKNKNNAIDGDELQQALKQLGYKLSPQLQGLLRRKYDVNWVSAQAPADGGPAAALPADHSTWSGITFDRFVRACTVVKQLNVLFEALERDPYGNVRIDYDAFVNLVFKLP